MKDGNTLGEVTRYDEMHSPDGKETVATYWTTAPLVTGEEYEFHFEDGGVAKVRVVLPGPPAHGPNPPGYWGWRGSADILAVRPPQPN